MDLGKTRVFLEFDGLSPEEAARLTVNGEDVGGVIGRPLRLEVTRRLKHGPNTFRIEPFAPKAASLLLVR